MLNQSIWKSLNLVDAINSIIRIIINYTAMICCFNQYTVLLQHHTEINVWYYILLVNMNVYSKYLFIAYIATIYIYIYIDVIIDHVTVHYNYTSYITICTALQIVNNYINIKCGLLIWILLFI